MTASPPITPSQIMDAAGKAEAEGRLDEALALYRHFVARHGADVAAHEARIGVERVSALCRDQRGAQRPGDIGRGANLPMLVSPEPYSAPFEMPAEPEFAFKDRYRAGTLMAQAANWAGWMLAGSGSALVMAGALAVPEALAAPSLLGLPAGIVLGLGASAAGVALVFLSQLALAVFDNANAARHLLAIERAKAEL